MLGSIASPELAVHSRRESVSTVQNRNHATAVVQKILPKDMTALEKEQIELARQQDELEARKSELRDVGIAYEGLNTHIDGLEAQIAHGEFTLGEVVQMIPECTTTLKLGSCGKHHNAFFNSITGMVQILNNRTALQALEKELPVFISAKREELAATKQKLVDFKKLNGIK
jgi:hypothetical protein